MEVLYLLVPLSVLAMLAILGVFAWALHGGQFDEVDALGAQILAGSDAAFDTRQASNDGHSEESQGPESTRPRSPP